MIVSSPLPKWKTQKPKDLDPEECSTPATATETVAKKCLAANQPMEVPYESLLKKSFSYPNNAAPALCPFSGQHPLAGHFLNPKIRLTPIPHAGCYEASLAESLPFGFYKSSLLGRGGKAVSLEDNPGKDGISSKVTPYNEVIAGNLSDLAHAPVLLILPIANFPLIYQEPFAATHTYDVGSLQPFLHGARRLSDFSPPRGCSLQSFFEVPREDLETMMCIDLRFANTDRNSGNLLYQQEQKRLHPIDHSLILSREFLAPATLLWMSYADSLEPFSEEMLRRIEQLRFPHDKQVIQKNFPRYPLPSLETMRISYHLLQRGASKGLSPFHLGLFHIKCTGMSSLLRQCYASARKRFPSSPDEVFECVQESLEAGLDHLKRLLPLKPQDVNAKRISDLQDGIFWAIEASCASPLLEWTEALDRPSPDDH